MQKIVAFNRDRQGAGAAGQPLPPQQVSPDGGAAPPQPQADTILVSIVVPTCGRPDLLNRCLGAVTMQRFDAHRYEVIVVDDRPHQNTRDIVIDWAKSAARRGVQVTYLPSPGPHGPAAARNFGWRAARGEIIAFTDDDTVARTDWIEKGLEAFRQGDVDAVWGRIVMPLHRTPTDYERDAKGLETAEFVTANCLCRKSVLERIGGFDERYRFAWREDADLYFNLLEAGAKIEHVPAAVIVHPIRPAHWGVSLSQQKKVIFDALLYKKHPRRYREKIRPRMRWDYYLIVLALFTALGGTLAQHWPVAGAGAAVWLLLTARFCARRLQGTVHTPSHVLEMIVTSALIPPVSVFWRLVGVLRFRAACF